MARATVTQSGHLRDKITIMANAAPMDQNTLGEPKENEDQRTICTVRANVQMGAGREFLAAQQVNPEITHVVQLRWREGITADMWVLYWGSRLDLDGPPINADGVGQWMQLNCIQSPDRE